MLGHEFYNSSLRKYQTIFSTLFNDIKVNRKDSNGNIRKRFKVPLAFAPTQKFLALLKQDPDKQKEVAIELPAMSYEITNIVYDPNRKLKTGSRSGQVLVGDNSEYAMKYTPVPYNIDFTLQIYTKFEDDGYQIVEQILPFFTPEWNSSAFMLDGIDKKFDIPIVLTSANLEDAYEGDFITRRVIIWTLTFTLYGYFYGPTYKKKVIKFIKTNFYSDGKEVPDEYFTIQPGMTAEGKPTTDINETIPWQNIEKEDDWDYIIQFSDDEGGKH